MALTDNIKKYRKLSGLSVSETASKLGITEANYYKWEKGPEQGGYNPNDENLKKLASLFNVKVKDFYSEDEPLVMTTKEEPKNAEHIYRDLVEANTEYRLVPKSILNEEYRIVLKSEIDEKSILLKDALKSRDALIDQLKKEIHDLETRLIAFSKSKVTK